MTQNETEQLEEAEALIAGLLRNIAAKYKSRGVKLAFLADLMDGDEAAARRALIGGGYFPHPIYAGVWVVDWETPQKAVEAVPMDVLSDTVTDIMDQCLPA